MSSCPRPRAACLNQPLRTTGLCASPPGFVCLRPGSPMNGWCPQCPVLTSSGQLLPRASSRSRPISYPVLLLFYCLLFSPAFLSFPKTPVLSLCAWNRTAAVLSFFTYSDVSGLIRCRGKKKKKKLRTHLFVFLEVQGIRAPLFQHRISNDSIVPIRLLHCSISAYVQSHWEHVGVGDLRYGI